MNNTTEVCTAHQNCTSEVAYACTCGNPVIFICKDCVNSHLCLPFTHIFISLDQARELTQDSMLTKRFGKRLSDYTEIKSDIQTYIHKISTFKLKIDQFKSQLILMIEKQCQSKLLTLAQMQAKAEESLDAINKFMKTVTSSDNQLFSRFEVMGLRGIIENYHDKFEILSSAVFKELSEMIHISDSLENSLISEDDQNRSILSQAVDNYHPYENRFIYMAKYNTKHLARYDAQSSQVCILDLSGVIAHNFIATGTCILPDKNVMIVGGYSNTYHGDTYKYNTATGNCVQLSSLHSPRGFVHLYCYDKYLYAFGGNSGSYSNKAERMDLSGNSWSLLPNMKEKRCAFGSFYMDCKLYLCGGFRVNTVEYYEFRENKFSIVHNLNVPKGFNTAGIVDDKIYHVTKDFITVFDKEFISREQKTIVKHSYVINLSGIVVRDGKLIFNWYNEEAVFELDTFDKDVRLLNKY